MNMTLLSAKSSVVGRTASCPRAVVQPCSMVAARPHAAVARRQRQLRAAADAGTATTAAVASVADMPEELLALVLDDSRPEGSTTTRSSNSSSSGGSDGSVGMVRVGAETDPARVAGYMRSRFDENGDDFTIILQALGAPACAQALKAVSRLQRRLAEDDAAAAGRCVVFRTQSTRLRLEERPQEKQQQGDGDAKLATASQLVVRLGPRSDWPDAAFRAERPQGSQGTDDKDASEEPQSRSKDSSSSSSSSSDGAAATRCIPTLVRPDDDPQKERQRLKGHALRATARQLPAQFVLSGNRARLANSALQLLAAVGAARRAALSSDEPFDLQCTIASSTYTVTRDPSRSSQSSQAKTESAPKADADSSAAAGAAGTESEPAGEAGAAAGADAAAAGESSTLTRTRYLVTVQRCEPSRNALAAARKWADAAAARGGSSGGSSARPRPTRPGFVEVREEEWNQLREQLAVVPHLTEQLQIMTRQHEQLLSLLAAQQGQQQEDQAP